MTTTYKSWLYYMLITVMITSCKKEVPFDFSDTVENTMLYMPQKMRNGSVISTNLLEFFPGDADSVYRQVFGAYYPGFTGAPDDITIDFEVDYSKLDSINRIELANGRTVFEKMPDSVLILPTLSTKVPAGTRSSHPLELGFRSSKIQKNHKYILPVTLKSVSGNYKINPFVKTTFFTATVVPYTWKIASASSEQTSGEPAPSGLASSAIDGNISTYWHSKWSAPAAVYPHWLVIDMGRARVIKGFRIKHRSGAAANRRIKDAEFYSSNDGVSFTSEGKYTFADVDDYQPFNIPSPKSMRYFKILAISGYEGNEFAAIAELDVF